MELSPASRVISSPMSLSLSSWPRMQPGQKNPFQNAPGPFIYALPNLDGTCPFTVSFCTFSGAGEPNEALNPDHPDHRHRGRRHNPVVTSRCCDQLYDDLPSESYPESTEQPTAPAEEGAPQDTESPPLPPLPPSPPQTPTLLSLSDETHFGLGDIDVSSSPLAEGGSELPAEQQELHATSELCTSNPSTALQSPTGSDFQDQEGSNGRGEEEEKEEKKVRHKRARGGKRRSRRRQREYVATVPPPRLRFPGAHNGQSINYACPPPVVNYHNAWPSVAGYRHPDPFALPPYSPVAPPQFWMPMVQVVPAPAFVGALPMTCW